MGRREQARAEAAFLRGEAGVDGRSSQEDERDEAQVQADKAKGELLRGRTWLGREFLTWLLWRSEGGDPLVEHQGGQVVVTFANRLVLRGLHGEVVELAVKGAMAPYSIHVRHALAEGLLVHAARIRLTSQERTWEATVDAEHLDVKSAKLPELLTEEEDDRLSERLDLAEQLSGMLDALMDAFLAVRTQRRWPKEVVPKLRAWMSGEERAEGSTLERAKRAAGR
jgi:hypothetical protein